MRLFVYGVLLGDIATGEAGRLMRAPDRRFPARARGALYAIEDEAGCYAALVPGPDGGEVTGTVYEVTPAQRAAIDVFERTGEDYDRRSLTVFGPDGTGIVAGAYCWRRPVGGLERIAHGDFARWLAETGKPPFGA